MPKHGPKPKALSKPGHNPYKYRLPGLFLGESNAFLWTAKGLGSTGEPIGDDINVDDTRRRSWTRKQKLGAIKYAKSTYVPGKTGQDELILHNAAALNIGCTPKMLCTWI
jgi:hypothetical protein